jgi:MFS family permease
MTQAAFSSFCRQTPQLPDLLRKPTGTISGLGLQFFHYSQKLDDLASRCCEGRFHLAVLGQFKRGKKGISKNKLGVAEAQVDLPAPILSGGVVLIDTPGIGSNYLHNTFATLMKGPLGIIAASRTAALLYLLRNVVYTAASYPIGALSDRLARNRYLAVGYGIAAITFLGFAFAPAAIGWLAFFFGLAGVFIAWEDTIENAAVRDDIDEATAGTAFGVLGVVNGVGDLVSSLAVGLLWTTFGAKWGFSYAVVVGLAGALWMGGVRAGKR